MRGVVLTVITACMLVWVCMPAPAAPGDAAVPFVRLHTGAGEILLVLFPDLAPNHVNNLLHLAGGGFMDGTYFHRIVPGFVIQGGDPNTRDNDPRTDGMGGPSLADVLTEAEQDELRKASAILEAKGYAGLSLGSRANLKAESSPTARHLRGTLSMARSRENDSAGSQFFICVAEARSLDRQYTIFGHVVDGMDAVDRIVSAPVESGRNSQRPLEPVTIHRAEILTGLDVLTGDELAAYRGVLSALAEAGSTW